MSVLLIWHWYKVIPIHVRVALINWNRQDQNIVTSRQLLGYGVVERAVTSKLWRSNGSRSSLFTNSMIPETRYYVWATLREKWNMTWRYWCVIQSKSLVGSRSGALMTDEQFWVPVPTLLSNRSSCKQTKHLYIISSAQTSNQVLAFGENILEFHSQQECLESRRNVSRHKRAKQSSCDRRILQTVAACTAWKIRHTHTHKS